MLQLASRVRTSADILSSVFLSLSMFLLSSILKQFSVWPVAALQICTAGKVAGFLGASGL